MPTEDSTEQHLLPGLFDHDACGAMLDRALRANISGPVVTEAVVDPFEAPMPAKATLIAQLNSRRRWFVAGRIEAKIVATQIADEVSELV